MRLISCHLQNVRVHSDLFVEFSSGITLIGGANESGKSTLIEALHRALFLKASATGGPVESLRSKSYLGHPIVQLTFEARGEVYSLRKCFSGSSGQITLNSQTSGSQLSGPIAEDFLAGLLGVKEILGSRQANNLLPTRWAHLWVMQGFAGKDLFKTSKANYDCDSLLNQLEKGGGAAIQQSTHDQRVSQLIDNALDENFTSRGIKKNSSLWKHKEELDAAERDLKSAFSKQLEYEKANEELVEISKRIEQLQNIELPKYLDQKRVLSEGTDEILRLQTKITLLETELEPIKLRSQAIQKISFELNELCEEIKSREEKRVDLQKKHVEFESNRLILFNDIKLKRDVLLSLKKKLQKIEQQRYLFQLLVDRSRSKETISRLNIDLQKNQISSEKINDLKKEIASLSKIERSDIEDMRDIQQRMRDILIQQRTMAISLKVLRSNQTISINGKELCEGQKKRIDEDFQLKIGDDVLLEVCPGGGDALSDLKNQYSAIEKEFSQRLSGFGLTSIEVASMHFEKRIGIEKQLSILEASSPTNIQTLKNDLNELNLKTLELNNKLSSLEVCRREFEMDQSIPNSLIDLISLQQKVQSTYSHTSLAYNNAEYELEAAQASYQNLIDSQANHNSDLKVIENVLSDRQEKVGNLKKQYGNDDSLKSQLSVHKKVLMNGQENLIKLKSQLKSLSSLKANDDLRNLQTKIKVLEENKEHLIAQMGAAKRTCDEISSNNPYSEVENAEVKLEIVRDEYQNILRITEAQKLLQKLFLQAQTDLSRRYTKPLAEAIESYLSPLVSDRPVTKLSFDQSSGFNNLQMRRGKEFYEFDELSGGMKEQLSAALRLSMADVLKIENNGCLPLVFDDAFTNSDPQRIFLIKQMLLNAVERGLQIIFLTCDPDAYGSFGDLKVLLDQDHKSIKSN